MEDASIPRGIGLVPLADMLNHQSRSARQTCDWRVEKSNKKEAFVIRPSPDDGLHAGSEACHSYGLYSNAHYLEYYGFCLETNCRHDGMSPNEAYNLPYSIENERRAMRRLLQSVEKALARYSTTLEEDETLLVSTNSKRSFIVSPGSNRRNAMLVRSGEKHILLHWLLLCKASLVCLDDVESGPTTWEFYCSLLDTTLGRTTSIAAASK
jgi:hypothetical protein